jgi:transposase IS116/IS110/IS902 family protein/transposase
VLGERPPAKILIEVSTESEWVARCLEELGHEVVVADPNFAAMYATRSRRVKTDRRDARTLAEACRLGAYRRAHRTSDRQRHVRAQLAVREALVQTRSRYISLVGAVLGRDGFRVGTGNAEGFVKRVERLVLPGQLKSEIAPLLAVVLSVNHQLEWVDGRLGHLAQSDETVARLCTAPSVGPVTAASFASTIDDVNRFRHAHQVEAYLGLTPSEMSSGERQHRRAHHQSGQLPDAAALGAGGGLHPASAQPANGGAEDLGEQHRHPAWKEDRHRGPGPAHGRNPLRNDARWQVLRGRTAQGGQGGRITTRAVGDRLIPQDGRRGDEKAGERESVLGCNR